jgi:hypothetical protein
MLCGKGLLLAANGPSSRQNSLEVKRDASEDPVVNVETLHQQVGVVNDVRAVYGCEGDQ